MNTSLARKPDRPSACIHIGLPKAASTTLQRHLFVKHSELEFLGKGGPNQYRTPTIERIIRELHRPQSDRTLDEWKRSVEEFSRPGLAAGRLTTASRELLCSGGFARQEQLAQNIERVFGLSKIIFVVRHPVRLLESEYLQRLRGNNLRYADDSKRPTGPFTVDDWLDLQWNRGAKGRFGLLRSHEILEPHITAFGRANVGVFLFEQLVQDSDAFIAAICRFMGIDPVQGVRLAATKHENRRLTVAQLKRLKSVYRSPWHRLKFRRGSVKQRRKMLEMARNSADEARISVDLPEAWRTRIEDYAREGGRYLKQEWGLSVEELGYPL